MNNRWRQKVKMVLAQSNGYVLVTIHDEEGFPTRAEFVREDELEDYRRKYGERMLCLWVMER